jgi:hypothetical protein
MVAIASDGRRLMELPFNPERGCEDVERELWNVLNRSDPLRQRLAG